MALQTSLTPISSLSTDCTWKGWMPLAARDFCMSSSSCGLKTANWIMPLDTCSKLSIRSVMSRSRLRSWVGILSAGVM